METLSHAAMETVILPQEVEEISAGQEQEAAYSRRELMWQGWSCEISVGHLNSLLLYRSPYSRSDLPAEREGLSDLFQTCGGHTGAPQSGKVRNEKEKKRKEKKDKTIVVPFCFNSERKVF